MELASIAFENGDGSIATGRTLVAMRASPLRVARARDPAGPGVIAGFGLVGALSVGMFLGGMPLVSMCVVAVALAFAAGTAAHGARDPGRAAPIPDAIGSLELRDTYRAIEAAYAEIERAIAEAPRLRSAVEPFRERCAAAVRLCGRLAVVANPLQRYLDGHDPKVIQRELDRLRERTEVTTDEHAASALGRAIAARTQQLATRDQIAASHDRIHARLELCHAALVSFAATIIKLQAADDEQLVLAAGSVTEHLDGVGDGLDSLEAAFSVDLAA